MIENPQHLIDEFIEAAIRTGIADQPPDIRHESQRAPHRPCSLRPRTCAVYIFSLSSSSVPKGGAGTNRVLKVGKAGPRSNSRFLSQHYNPKSAPSTLAGSLLKAMMLWRYLGVAGLDDSTVGAWIREHCDRDNFYLPDSQNKLLVTLERYLRGRLGPVFEGG